MSFQAMTWAVEQELPALQKLVLLMLANYCNHHTGQCNPSYDRLASECGMSKTSVRDAIKALNEKGILEIEHRSIDGVSLPNQYRLMISQGVCRHAADGMPPDDRGVCRQATPNQEVEPGIEPKDERAPRFDAQAHLSELGVDEQVAKDWLIHRKAVKASPTETAIKGIVRESSKAGISLQSALELCCQRGWRGFKAEWVKNDRQETWYEKNDRVMAELTGRGSNERDDGPFVDV